MGERESKKKKKRSGGAADEVKGRVKEAVGALTGDDDLKREGALDRAAGDAKNRISEAVDKVRDGVGSLFDEKDGKKKGEKKA